MLPFHEDKVRAEMHLRLIHFYKTGLFCELQTYKNTHNFNGNLAAYNVL